MEKRGPNLRILLLYLLALLAIGVILWLLVADSSFTGQASLAPPTYSEFVTTSLCENPTIDSITHHRIDHPRCRPTL